MAKHMGIRKTSKKRLGTINNIDTNTMLVFKSESLHPQTKNSH